MAAVNLWGMPLILGAQFSNCVVPHQRPIRYESRSLLHKTSMENLIPPIRR